MLFYLCTEYSMEEQKWGNNFLPMLFQFEKKIAGGKCRRPSSCSSILNLFGLSFICKSHSKWLLCSYGKLDRIITNQIIFLVLMEGFKNNHYWTDTLSAPSNIWSCCLGQLPDPLHPVAQELWETGGRTVVGAIKMKTSHVPKVGNWYLIF